MPPEYSQKAELCPVVESIYTIGNKWTLVIIHNLMKEPKRFNELKNCIHGISSKVLTENLCDLQKKGIIEKKTNIDQPDKIEYVLTNKGEDLRKVMAEIRCWGEKWLVSMEDSSISEIKHIEREIRMVMPAGK